METLQIYTASDGERTVAFTPEELAELGLDEEEARRAVFGDAGAMYEVTLREPTFARHLEIERACKAPRDDGAGFERDTSRLPAARIRVMVEAWTLPGSPADGCDRLPAAVALALDEMIRAHLYPSLGNTRFFARWRALQTPSEPGDP